MFTGPPIEGGPARLVRPQFGVWRVAKRTSLLERERRSTILCGELPAAVAASAVRTPLRMTTAAGTRDPCRRDRDSSRLSISASRRDYVVRPDDSRGPLMFAWRRRHTPVPPKGGCDAASDASDCALHRIALLFFDGSRDRPDLVDRAEESSGRDNECLHTARGDRARC